MGNVFSLEGRVCLVTGGGTGIGKAIAASLVGQGARVVITGRNGDRLEQTARELGDAVVPRVHDLTDLDSIPEFLRSVERDVGPVRTLVNNAGIHQKKETLEVSDDDFAAVLLTNTRAVFALTREAAGTMVEQGGGDIQMISSMAAIFGVPYVASYTTSKSAVTGLVRQLAMEWGGSGIRVNAIAPGWIESEMSRRALEKDPERKAKVLGRTPMGRLGTPEEIGAVSAFLASDAAGFVSGALIPVDGGAAIGF